MSDLQLSTTPTVRTCDEVCAYAELADAHPGEPPS